MSKDYSGIRSKRSDRNGERLAVSSVASGKWNETQIDDLIETIRHRRSITAVMSKQDMALLLVFKTGPGVFENRADFIQWMTLPQHTLGGKTPLKLLASSKATIVLNELLRIEYGMVA